MLIEFMVRDLNGNKNYVRDMRNCSYWGPHNDLAITSQEFAFEDGSPTVPVIKAMLIAQRIMFDVREPTW